MANGRSAGEGPDGRGARSQRTRVALIAAALDSLREDGFAGASARRIAERAGCNQALVFYHFGTVTDLLLAALDEVSATRLAAYRGLVEQATTLSGLIEAAQKIFCEDLAGGHVAVLIEMINGARATPNLGEQVAARLEPWRQLAESAVRTALAGSPVQALVPVREAAHAVVAGLLGLELLADLDDSDRSGGSGRDAARALFDRAAALGTLLDVLAPAKRR